mmetsp:Transcript_14115/g.22049  ORF Transcript_14115/g.22049 Transcript_14115/m.22049 type:complete len:382 (+) Transcript_14115:84-1229(+)|eukprot:CAMPEP_0195296534 /NCGR_PEP_ID=MMETSP0707-20130614/19669_1 /TAXON_ID=33640 /ORGANISM="Asterionellopsis glacialis, Strain CCMP134" /LENGTH=381 /DNA_ID=CAMNT_0040358067 /DNA_START=34 /DNA_END=1179 /DNA_ORIENTATION=+
MAGATGTTQQPVEAANNPPRGGVAWWLRVVTLVLRIVLWPLRRLMLLTFPDGAYDGLSPAVTAKAVQAFCSQLLELATTPSQTALARDAFGSSALGFSALRSEAANSSSLMLVYLHSPLQRKANATLKRILLDEHILSYINGQNNLCAMGVSIHTAQGANLAQMLSVTSYPVLALLQPTQRDVQLLFMVQGPLLQEIAPLSLLGYIQTSVQRHRAHLDQAEARRIAREQEAELRREQDAEYQETLRQDQERQRLREEALEAERKRQEEFEEEQQRLADEEQNKLQKAKDLLQPEPSSGGTRIRFVLPNGKKVNRRFNSDETVASLRAFLTVHCEENSLDIKNFGLSTSYPKKSYEESENETTLEDAGISPQAVLMVQDMDA